MWKGSFCFLSALLLSGCSNILPLDYSQYEGSDAATIYARNYEGSVGTIYITTYKYVDTDACFDMDTRYELDSNVFAASGNVIKAKIKPGNFYAYEQTRNYGRYIADSRLSFIPEPGKTYYIMQNERIFEIPDSEVISMNTDEQKLFNQYGKNLVKGWPAKNKCKNFMGKLMSK